MRRVSCPRPFANDRRPLDSHTMTAKKPLARTKFTFHALNFCDEPFTLLYSSNENIIYICDQKEKSNNLETTIFFFLFLQFFKELKSTKEGQLALTPDYRELTQFCGDVLLFTLELKLESELDCVHSIYK